MLLLLVKRISNSLCLQWGNDTIKNKNSHTFPITFNSIYQVIGMLHASSGSYFGPSSYPHDFTTSGFTTVSSQATTDVYYIAIGKKA